MTARYYLYFGISLFALFITMTFTSIYVIENHVKVVNQLSNNIEKQASSSSAIFKDREDQNKLDLEFFTDLVMMQDSLNNQYNQPLDDLFKQLMSKKSSIVQVRLLNLQGEELYRIDNKFNVPTRLSFTELQNKSHRYYIQELLDTPISQTYMSKIDLNVEHGVIRGNA